MHSLSGSVPWLTGAHTPLVPPVFEARQARQVPSQASSQQIPSSSGQDPLAHCSAAEQPSPGSFFSTHSGAAQ
jgi:hypothetical protein